MRPPPLPTLFLLFARLHIVSNFVSHSVNSSWPCLSHHIFDDVGGHLVTLTCHRLAAEEGRREACSEGRDDNSALQLALLLPGSDVYEGSLQRVVPAVVMALRELRQRLLLPGRSFALHVRDTGCSSIYAPAHAVESYFTDQVELLLGPYCDYALGEVTAPGL